MNVKLQPERMHSTVQMSKAVIHVNLVNECGNDSYNTLHNIIYQVFLLKSIYAKVNMLVGRIPLKEHIFGSLLLT